jgi:glycosyltransferase involved in cell wall biosynthesis
VTSIAVPERDASARAGIAAALGARRRLRAADVVHVEFGSNDQGVFWFALAAALLSANVVAVVHDHPKIANHPAAAVLRRRTRVGQLIAYRILVPLLDGLLKRQLLQSAAVVASFSEEACHGFATAGARRVVTLTHGADAVAAGARPPSAGDSILFAGFHGPGKGIDVLLQAWSRYGADVKLPLVIAGGGNEEWVREVIGNPAQYPTFPQFPGPIPSESDFQRLFERAAIVVLPYRYSSPASGILIRAMATGRAIITTPVPAARGLESGVNAVIVPIEDVDTLGAAIVALDHDPEERDRLGNGALATAQRLYTWEQHLIGLETAYRMAAASGGR